MYAPLLSPGDPPHEHRTRAPCGRRRLPMGMASCGRRAMAADHAARPQRRPPSRRWDGRFPAPVGVAAGLDKDAVAVKGLWLAGFSHVEIGTITPKAQPGNEQPRAWRELDVRGLRNRMGFNNEGADAAARQLATLEGLSRSARRAVVGVNIGKNKVTAAEDAAARLRLLRAGARALRRLPRGQCVVAQHAWPAGSAVRRCACGPSWSTPAPGADEGSPGRRCLCS